MSNASSHQIVLVGAGHAHLYVARHARRLMQRGAAVTLIDPGLFWYSGLATGMLGGMYSADEDQIDPRRLIEAQGGRFMRDRVAGVDRAARRVLLAGGESVAYDLLSFNVGSRVPMERLGGAAEHVWPVKPISRLWDLRRHLEERLSAATDEPLRIVVIGGGATGCEVAANLDGLLKQRKATANLTVLTHDSTLLNGYPARAGRRMMRSFDERGVRVVTECEARGIEAKSVLCADGRSVAADVIVVATGLVASKLVGELDLPTAPDGGLRVDDTLRSIGDTRLFAAGDCAHIEGRDLPKLGVFGVRAAPVLLDNLAAAVSGEPMRRYRPQKRYLSILNMGDGRGLAAWGPFCWHGRLMLWWKDRLDRRFLAMYRTKDARKTER